MKQKLLLFIIAACITQSCKNAVAVWKNDNIDREVQAEIKALNDKLYQSIFSNNIQGVRELMSASLNEKAGKSLDTLIGEVSASLNASTYRRLDEYYVTNLEIGTIQALPSGYGGKNEYTMNFKALNKEVYIALLLPDSFTNQIMITAVYGKYDNAWKLNFLLFGQYSMFGKTVEDYFEESKKDYAKEHMVDAFHNIVLAQEGLHPA